MRAPLRHALRAILRLKLKGRGLAPFMFRLEEAYAARGIDVVPANGNMSAETKRAAVFAAAKYVRLH
jgi:hypothetical protein